MVDYVWICRDGENEELRYSIRSVVKNMPPGNVWVVGGKPKWYTGNHIAVTQRGPKMQNAIRNLEALCKSNQISENFVLMNDDFFVIRPVGEIKTYCGGSLLDKADTYEDYQPRSSYTASLYKTHHGLIRMGISNPIDYELHVPMPMSKSNLERVIRRDYLFRSLYGNMYALNPIRMDSDVKVYGSGAMSKISYNYLDMKYDYISSNDDSFDMMLDKILIDMFPQASGYESD